MKKWISPALFSKRNKRIVVFVCIIIAAGVFLSLRQRRINRDIIAMVNGYPVTVADIIAESQISPESYRESLRANPEAVLENYINQVLLFRKAQEYERELRNEVAARMKTHYIKELTSAYVEEIIARSIEISEEAIAEYYNRHLEDFVLPERVRLFEIVVLSQGEAENLLRRLERGESFEDIARRESISESRERSGDIGWIDIRKLEPEISSLVSRISPGDILANPIRTEAGFHIIKLAGKSQRRMLTLQEASPVIENMLAFQEKRREVDSIVRSLREQADINIFRDKIEELKRN